MMQPSSATVASSFHNEATLTAAGGLIRLMPEEELLKYLKLAVPRERLIRIAASLLLEGHQLVPVSEPTAVYRSGVPGSSLSSVGPGPSQSFSGVNGLGRGPSADQNENSNGARISSVSRFVLPAHTAPSSSSTDRAAVRNMAHIGVPPQIGAAVENALARFHGEDPARKPVLPGTIPRGADSLDDQNDVTLAPPLADPAFRSALASRNTPAGSKPAKLPREQQCPECPYKGVGRPLSDHLKAHGRPSAYKCNLCSFSSSKRYVTIHSQLHLPLNQPGPLPFDNPAPPLPPANPSPRSRSQPPAASTKKHSHRARAQTPGAVIKGKSPSRSGNWRNPVACHICSTVIHNKEALMNHIGQHRKQDAGAAASSGASDVNFVAGTSNPGQTTVVQPRAIASLSNGLPASSQQTSEPRSDHIPISPRAKQSGNEQDSVRPAAPRAGVSSIVDGPGSSRDLGGISGVFGSAVVASITVAVKKRKTTRPKTAYAARPTAAPQYAQEKAANLSLPVQCFECNKNWKNWRAFSAHHRQVHNPNRLRSAVSEGRDSTAVPGKRGTQDTRDGGRTAVEPVNYEPNSDASTCSRKSPRARAVRKPERFSPYTDRINESSSRFIGRTGKSNLGPGSGNSVGFTQMVNGPSLKGRVVVERLDSEDEEPAEAPNVHARIRLISSKRAKAKTSHGVRRMPSPTVEEPDEPVEVAVGIEIADNDPESQEESAADYFGQGTAEYLMEFADREAAKRRRL